MKALLFFIILFCAAPSTSHEKRAFFFGDSVTAGNYPRLTKGISPDYKFSVFARNGARTKDVLGIMRTILGLDSLERPTHVVIYAGINDCVGNPPGAADRAIDNLGQMISLARPATVIIFKVHTRNGCACEINRWLDSVLASNHMLTVLSPDVGPKTHPTREDETKMAVAVAGAIMGY